MINEGYVIKILRLIKAGLITTADIKDPVYKAEVESRIAAAANQ